MKLKDQKNIGLALGGGAVLGAAHVGVLRTIEEFKIPIHYISGTSIGAFIASLYAFGMKWQEIEEIAVDLNWLDVSGIALSQYGVISNRRLGKVLDKHIGDKTFADLSLPLAVIAVDISSGEKVVLREGKVAEAVMASACIPGVFIPVKMGNKLLLDGGILEPVPITPLLEMGAETTIGVNLFARRSYHKPSNVANLLINALDMMMVHIARLQLTSADLVVEPDLDKFNLVDTRQVPKLIEIGYTAACETFAGVV